MLRVNHLAGFAKRRGVAGAGGGGVDPNPKTLSFACGFECGHAAASAHWILGGGTNPTFVTSTKRSGDRALRCNHTAQSGTLGLNLTAGNTTVARFYIRFATLPNANTSLFYLNDTTGWRYGVGFQSSSSTLKAHYFNSSGGTFTFGASGVTVTTGVWYRVDIKITYASLTKVIDVKVDGTDCTQASSNLTETAISGNPRLGSSTSSTTDFYVDDFIYSTTSGDYPLGAGHVNHFVPVSDGTHSTGTAGNFKVGAAGANITDASTTSYQLIDDVPLDDVTPDTDDYINLAADTGATANYVEHVIGPAPGISTPTLGPRGVEVIYAYHAATTGTGAHILKINDNGTEDDVQSFNAAGSASIRYARKHYADPPSAASVWTTIAGAGNFNNLRSRFGFSNDGNPDQYLDCVMIEAEFSD